MIELGLEVRVQARHDRGVSFRSKSIRVSPKVERGRIQVFVAPYNLTRVRVDFWFREHRLQSVGHYAV